MRQILLTDYFCKGLSRAISVFCHLSLQRQAAGARLFYGYGRCSRNSHRFSKFETYKAL